MDCPECHSARSKVVAKTNYPEGIVRRRECLGCAARYTTREFPSYSLPRVQHKQVSFQILP